MFFACLSRHLQCSKIQKIQKTRLQSSQHSSEAVAKQIKYVPNARVNELKIEIN